MGLRLKERYRSYEDARAAFDRFHMETADVLLEPGSEEHEEYAALADGLAKRFAELAEMHPATAKGACLLQQAVLAHIGEMIRDEDRAAYEAMQRVAEFLATNCEPEKKSD